MPAVTSAVCGTGNADQSQRAGTKTAGPHAVKLNEAERLSAVLGLSMYERDLCFFEEQNRREALARRADEKRRGECDKRAEK